MHPRPPGRTFTVQPSRDLVEVREGRMVSVMPRSEFEELLAERFFRDGAVARGYWEERFVRVDDWYRREAA